MNTKKTENTKYLVKKEIPLKTPLKKGDVFDNTHPFFKLLDVNDSNFFEVYYEPIYKINEKLLFRGKRDVSPQLYYIYSIVNPKSYTIKHVSDGRVETITDKTLNVKKPTFFWFVNSDGKLCEDYEERPSLSLVGLNFKRRIGNYHLKKVDAERYRDDLLKINGGTKFFKID
jgi:hypothetical protein